VHLIWVGIAIFIVCILIFLRFAIKRDRKARNQKV
jgi:hypothetical protein